MKTFKEIFESVQDAAMSFTNPIVSGAKIEFNNGNQLAVTVNLISSDKLANPANSENLRQDIQTQLETSGVKFTGATQGSSIVYTSKSKVDDAQLKAVKSTMGKTKLVKVINQTYSPRVKTTTQDRMDLIMKKTGLSAKLSNPTPGDATWTVTGDNAFEEISKFLNSNYSVRGSGNTLTVTMLTTILTATRSSGGATINIKTK